MTSQIRSRIAYLMPTDNKYFGDYFAFNFDYRINLPVFKTI